MRKIANILANNKKNPFGEIFNVVQVYEDLMVGIPTLIIGLENAKKYIDGFNIIDKQYGDVWWTFKKTERRCEYEDDIMAFYNYAILHEMEKNQYIYIDILNYGYNKAKKILNFFNSSDKKYVFLTKNSNFMFVYCEKYNAVFGLSLELCEYLGYEKNRIYKLMRNCEYVKNTKFIIPEIKKAMGYNTHYILPLYSCLK